MELSLLGIVVAFTAGVISFLSPCVLPLVPGYVSYIAGAFTINFDAALRQQQAHVFAFDADTFTEIAIEASDELSPLRSTALDPKKVF